MSTKHEYRFPFAKYPAIRFGLLLIAGIILSKLIHLNTYYWGGLFTFIIGVWFIAEYFTRRNWPIFSTSIATYCYLAGIICFGALWHSMLKKDTAPSAQLFSAYRWEPIEVQGTVQNINQTSTGKYQLDVVANSTIIEDSLQWLEEYTLRAVYDPAEKPLPKNIALGTRIHFQATVYPLEGKSNPHDFDYKNYLASQGIYTQVGITSILDIQLNDNMLSWNWWRQHALKLIEHNFSKETIAVAKALLLGYKNDLQHDDKIAFSRVGLSHIMAVSGLHVGFIIAPFWIIIPFFWSFRWGKQTGLFLLIALLVIYAGLTGFSASVTRASITGGLLAYGKLFHKSRDSKNLTAVAAIIILLVNPNELFEIGFQLSFAAVYIIFLVLPVIQNALPNKIQHRWYGNLVMIVIVSLVVQLGLYPLLSYYFGEFSLIGPLANALIVPWLGMMVPYAIFLLLVSTVWPGAGFVMNAPCRLFLEFLQWFVTTAASWHWSWMQTQVTGVFIFLIWIAAIFYISSLSIPKIRWKMLILFLAIFCCQQASKLYQNLQPSPLKIILFDVGQGDAAYIRTPNGKHLLIDAGRWTPTYNSARYVIIPHLEALGVQKLDAVFLSHPHADHIGGIIELLNKIEIGMIYNAGFAYDSELYKNYIKLAKKRGIPVEVLAAGNSVPIDHSMRLFVYGPGKNNHHSDPNEHSLVMELIYGKTEFLFTGDAGSAQEQLFLRNFQSMVDTDFLKVGHHGSRTSSSSPFLNTATPDYAAVSLALSNKFKHPHAKAIDRLRESKSELLFTSLDGALQFESDGEIIQRIKWR